MKHRFSCWFSGWLLRFAVCRKCYSLCATTAFDANAVSFMNHLSLSAKLDFCILSIEHHVTLIRSEIYGHTNVS